MIRPHLSHAFGQSLRSRRTATGLAAEDVARAAQRCGLATWDRTVVQLIESGRRRLTVEEAVLLPLVIEVATGEPVTLAALAGGPVELSETVSLDADGWARLLEGEPLITPSPVRVAGRRPRAPQAAANLLRTADARTEVGEAERKAARTLGVPVAAIVEVSGRIWRRSLTDERNRRVQEIAPEDASPRSIQAYRGRVSRHLLDELRSALDPGRTD